MLHKNRRSQLEYVLARAFPKSPASEYETSLAKLLPIKARLAATYWLINQIVCELYGLNEEEKGIIEKHAGLPGIRLLKTSES